MSRTTASLRPRWAVRAGGVAVGPAVLVATDALELGVHLLDRGHRGVNLSGLDVAVWSWWDVSDVLGDAGGADTVAVGDGRQPLDVAAEQPAEHLGLGLAQLRELVGDVRDRAVLLAELLADRVVADRGGVAARGSAPRPAPRRAPVAGARRMISRYAVSSRATRRRANSITASSPPVSARKRSAWTARSSYCWSNRSRPALGQREHLRRAATTAGAVHTGLAGLDRTLLDQVVEMAPDSGGRQVQPLAEHGRRAGPELEDRPGHALARRSRRRHVSRRCCRFPQHHCVVNAGGVSNKAPLTPPLMLACSPLSAARSPSRLDCSRFGRFELVRRKRGASHRGTRQHSTEGVPRLMPVTSPSNVDGAAVVIEDLRMTYGDTVAVDGLSLEVAPGSITAVLGPNGAGKTTTLETCEGYRRAAVRPGPRARARPARPTTATLLPRIGVMLQTGGAWSGVPPSRCSDTSPHSTRTRSTWTCWSTGSASARAGRRRTAGSPAVSSSGSAWPWPSSAARSSSSSTSRPPAWTRRPAARRGSCSRSCAATGSRSC